MAMAIWHVFLFVPLNLRLVEARSQFSLQTLRSNKSWDFENMTSHYIELFGEHVACLELSGGGNTIQTVFRQGEAQLKVSHLAAGFGERGPGWIGDAWIGRDSLRGIRRTESKSGRELQLRELGRCIGRLDSRGEGRKKTAREGAKEI